MTRSRLRQPVRARVAFSLVEVIMAIFILGIGVISIAALFPAGIAQQRQSVDDVMGPIVANNAMSILRNKVRSEDFGTFEAFSPATARLSAERPTVAGDWSWVRPSTIFDGSIEDGAIDLFSSDWTNGNQTDRATEYPMGYRDDFGVTSDPSLFGVPFNRRLYGAVPPRIIVTQRERYYPMGPESATTPLRPQFVWDCMFRRFQGRVLVAIFVYRVSAAGGEGLDYRVAPSMAAPTRPPVPATRLLGNFGSPAGGWDAYGVDTIAGTPDDAIVVGAMCDSYDVYDPSQSWQEPGQWLLDQNNTVHRVLSATCIDSTREIELVRPVPEMPFLPVFWLLPAPNAGDNAVSDLWYMPAVDSRGVKLTPVYVTVKEL